MFRFQVQVEVQASQRLSVFFTNLKAHKNLKAYVKDMKDCGLIFPYWSNMLSQVLLITKGEGNLRPCVDYKRLNLVIEKDNYHMTLIQDIINMIAGAQVFSKLNMNDSFD